MNHSVKVDTLHFTSNMPYFKIHNDGGTINHPEGTAYFSRKGNAVWVSNRKAMRYKSLTKKDLPRTKPHKIKMPQRQIVGEHPQLFKEIDKYIFKLIDDVIV